jgi:hypothetical protein
LGVITIIVLFSLCLSLSLSLVFCELKEFFIYTSH